MIGFVLSDCTYILPAGARSGRAAVARGRAPRRFRGGATLLLWLGVLLGAVAASAAAVAAPTADELKELRKHPYFGHNIIVVIDKGRAGSSLNAQRLRYYRYNPDTERLSFVSRWRVSTGAEIPKENEVGRVTPRTTLLGFYTVDVLQEDAYSNSWDGPMAFSVFYDFPRYAIHATEWFNYFRLGRRASGGCTRLHRDHAVQFFHDVATLGKGWTYRVNRYSGRPATSASGAPVVQWSYRALVIIQENGEMEPTHFGLRPVSEIYATKNSVHNYIDFPDQPMPEIVSDPHDSVFGEEPADVSGSNTYNDANPPSHTPYGDDLS